MYIDIKNIFSATMNDIVLGDEQMNLGLIQILKPHYIRVCSVIVYRCYLKYIYFFELFKNNNSMENLTLVSLSIKIYLFTSN